MEEFAESTKRTMPTSNIALLGHGCSPGTVEGRFRAATHAMIHLSKESRQRIANVHRSFFSHLSCTQAEAKMYYYCIVLYCTVYNVN